MSLENIGKEKLTEKIQILLQIIINDLKNLKEPNKAGWRKLSDLKEMGVSEADLSEISKLGIVEKNFTDEVRIMYKDNKIRQKLSSFDIQFQQIDYFLENQEMLKQDNEKIQRADRIIEQVISNMQNEEFLPNGVVIGIWRMLSGSDMPAVVDDIISAGFSPKDWGIISLRSAHRLSLELAKKVGKIENLANAFSYMKNLGFIGEVPSLDNLEADIVSKVKEVLRWQKICDILNERDIKFLGISWFLVYVLEENDALPSYIDFSTKVTNLIKKAIESIMKDEYSNLVESLLNSISTLEEQHKISWASNIIFLPEVL